ncbi:MULTISPECIES: MGH1-like glycoside hydrolase domain-containing protein [unclassified Streptomyces]|uniref:MGH1-like glycoside hydrolase domain-containing protein n=1 Tax=unclassified Streptomyces TaxID=2593676 RepID=UPI0037F3E13B
MDRTAQLIVRPAEYAVAYDPATPPGPPQRATAHPGAAHPGTPHSGTPRSGDLRRRAANVLAGNRTGNSTVPSPGLYPHQWSWDSAFIAIGLRHVSPRRAQTELETLLDAQWGDGRIPHIVFNPSVPLDAYFPSPDFWRSSTAGRAAGAPRTVQTSGIVQPPVHALATWLVHCADPGLSRARGFLTRMYPRLAAWHRYLLHRRDLGGGGLVSVVHPWEQGMDNAPSWDAPLSRIAPAPARSFRRADLDHGAPEDRPTDLDYGRYVRLATEYRDGGYEDGGVVGGHGVRGGHGVGGREFAVEDPSFNALLIASEHALARIAHELGATGTARHARAERLTAALVERLWDPAEGMFFCRDLRGGDPERGRDLRGGDPGRRPLTGALIPERGISGLVPLLLPGLPREVAAGLVRTLRGPHFGLGTATRLAPSYDLLGEAFDPHRYWRGPAWFNTSWLLERGLRLHGDQPGADALRRAVLDIADSSDFAEYVDPYTGEACGATGFSWTAALTLDLLHDDTTSGTGAMTSGTTVTTSGTTVTASGTGVMTPGTGITGITALKGGDRG